MVASAFPAFPPKAKPRGSTPRRAAPIPGCGADSAGLQDTPARRPSTEAVVHDTRPLAVARSPPQPHRIPARHRVADRHLDGGTRTLPESHGPKNDEGSE